jgi:peptidoglycan-associated lipoprotein
MFNKTITLSTLLVATLITACAGNNIKQHEESNDKQKSVKNIEVIKNSDMVLSDFPVEATKDISTSELALKSGDTNIDNNSELLLKKPKIKIVNFNFDKFDLSDTNKSLIKQHAEFLKANPSYVLSVNGHSDYRGPEVYNEKLSLRRANSVAKLLVSFGAPESQLIINSFGASQPVEDFDNWFQNRRVEFEYSELYMVSK